MQIWIGTSGYSYSDWVGPFYPEGTSRQDFLGNIGKPISARACPTKAGGTQFRGSAEFLELPDGQVRIVGQLVEKITPDQFHF